MGSKIFLVISETLGDIYSTAFLAVVYLLILPIFAIIYQFRRSKLGSWSKWHYPINNLEDLRRQF